MVSLMNLIDRSTDMIILGDFNIDTYGSEKSCSILQELSSFGFSQNICEPTYIEGGIIDHCHVSKYSLIQRLKLSQKSVYYTDHDIIEVLCKSIK